MSERGPGIEYGDADILNNTKQDWDGNKFKLSAGIPPSGRLFESEWIHKDNAKGVALSWCQAVRDQIDADWAENRKKIEEGKQQLRSDPLRTTNSVVAEDTKIEVEEGTTVGVADPEKFIRTMLDTARNHRIGCASAHRRATKNLEKAEEDLAKWEAVAASLNLGEKENGSNEESTEECDDGDSGSVRDDLDAGGSDTD